MKIYALVTIFLTLLTSTRHCHAADETPDLSRVPAPTGLVTPGTKATVAALVSFLEGPAVDAEGNLFFSEIAGNQILKMTPRGEIVVFRTNSGRTNGNAFDARGRLVSCEGFGLGPGGRRRVVRTDMKTGLTNVLTEPLPGQALQQPQRSVHRRSGADLVHRSLLRRSRPYGDERRRGLSHRCRRSRDARSSVSPRCNGPTASPLLRTAIPYMSSTATTTWGAIGRFGPSIFPRRGISATAA